MPGSCLPVSTLCAGNEGMLACDDSGTLFKCGANSTIESEVARCTSLELCKPGIKAGKCATCVPGKSQCTGKNLELCGEQGQGFEKSDTCATAELCDAASRKCTPPSCEAGQMKCQGNSLVKCNAEQNGFVMAMSCPMGCNDSKRACNVCTPGETKCSGNALVKCADGSAESRTSCSGSTPKCNVDRCVECVGTETMACGSGCNAGMKRCQNGAFGSCEAQPKTTPEILCNGKDDDCDSRTADDDCPQAGSSVRIYCRGTMDMGTKCMPDGTYLESCSGCTYEGSTLKCTSANCIGTCSLNDPNLVAIWQEGKLVCGERP